MASATVGLRGFHSDSWAQAGRQAQVAALAGFTPQICQELSLTNLLSTLATIWRLAIPYFRSEDRVAGRVLLASVVAIELAVVAINVLINQWNARFYNALQ